MLLIYAIEAMVGYTLSVAVLGGLFSEIKHGIRMARKERAIRERSGK